MNRTDTAATGEQHPESSLPGRLLALWPSLVGLAALIATAAGGLNAHLTAMVIMIAALCYLTSAAVGRRVAAWIAIPVLTGLVAVAMVTAIDAIVLLLALAAAMVVVGLIRLPRSGWRELGLQAAGFAGFAGLGLIAMMITPLLAAHLAALIAIGHGVWDLVHHRRDKVVVRSFTEFCAVLDFGLGGVTLIITWIGLAS